MQDHALRHGGTGADDTTRCLLSVLCGWSQIMYQVFSGQKPPLDRTDMPEAYGLLINDCWQDDPEQRPTFAAILLRLRGMYKDERQRLHTLQVCSRCALHRPCQSQSCMTQQGSGRSVQGRCDAPPGGTGSCNVDMLSAPGVRSL